MNNLSIIENGIIPVYQSDKGTCLVNMRELHAWLEVGRDFPTWIKDRIEKYGFVKNEDYLVFPNSGENSEGRPRLDYIFKLEPAKEIAMVENNEKGKEIRRYFIKVEEKYKQSQKIPKTFAEALRLAADLEEEKQKLLPKAQGYDYLMNAEGTVTIGEAAAIIDIKGIGQNKFFKLLCAEKIIFKKGNSYVPYSDFKGHFIVKQNPIRIGDMVENRSQLYLDMKGLDWLAKFLARRGYEVNYKQLIPIQHRGS